MRGDDIVPPACPMGERRGNGRGPGFGLVPRVRGTPTRKGVSMTKFLAVALVAVCALTASLYATAAPTKQGPTNVQLAAQIASLRTQVRILKADVSWLSGRAKSTESLIDCNLRPLWMFQLTTFSALAALYRDDPLPLNLVQAFQPKRPDCG